MDRAIESFNVKFGGGGCSGVGS